MTATRLEKMDCILCGERSSPTGEHVWPKWLNREFNDQGPFTLMRGGDPFTTRAGQALTSQGIHGVFVPMCEKCNLRMSGFVENPAKNLIRRIFFPESTRLSGHLSQDEAERVSRWFLKVVLLTAHPQSSYKNERVDQMLRRSGSRPTGKFRDFHPEWLTWMREGASPPESFSVFITKNGSQQTSSHDGSKLRIVLPKLIVDGTDLRFMHRSVGLRDYEISVVWHPGWSIRHPLVESRRALQLWPNPASVNISSLPAVDPNEFQFVDGSISSVQISARRYRKLAERPLSVDTDVTAELLHPLTDTQ